MFNVGNRGSDDSVRVVPDPRWRLAVPGAHRVIWAMASGMSVFNCILCGECCRGDQKVWLNPLDLERLAHHLALAGTEDLIEKRIIVLDAGEHGILRPRLRFPPGPAGPSCSFLINDLDEEGRLWGKCSLHETEAKPLVCRLAPLSREIDLADGSESWIEIAPVVGCPGWGEDAPPEQGRRIAEPLLEGKLRRDLDEESDYFRKLESDLE